MKSKLEELKKELVIAREQGDTATIKRVQMEIDVLENGKKIEAGRLCEEPEI